MPKTKHLLLLMLTLASCGKKISSLDPDDKTRRDYLEATTITLNAISQEDYDESESYQYLDQGFINIVPEIEIISGQTLSDWKVRLDFNINNNKGDIYCYYGPNLNKVGVASFQNCYVKDINNDGIDDEINYLPGDEYEIDKNHEVKLSILRGDNTPPGPIQVMGQFDIRWF